MSKSIKIALKKQRGKSSLKMCLPVDRVVPVEREARKDPGPGVPQGGKEGTPPLDYLNNYLHKNNKKQQRHV